LQCTIRDIYCFLRGDSSKVKPSWSMRKDGTDIGNLGAVPCESTVDCSIFSSEAHIVPDMANTFHAWKSRCQVDPNTPVKIDTAVYSLVAGAGLVEKFLQFDVV
jgi:hypothetical protein